MKCIQYLLLRSTLAYLNISKGSWFIGKIKYITLAKYSSRNVVFFGIIWIDLGYSNLECSE